MALNRRANEPCWHSLPAESGSLLGGPVHHLHPHRLAGTFVKLLLGAAGVTAPGTWAIAFPGSSRPTFFRACLTGAG